MEETKKLSLSQSVYGKLNEMFEKSPTAMISSICALFIVIILSLTLPLYFPIHHNNTTTDENNTL